MRYFFASSIIVLALALFVHIPITRADAPCDAGGGPGSGSLLNGQCISNGGGTGTGGYENGGTGTGNPSATLINPLQGANCSSGNGDCLMAFLNNILKFVIRIGAIVVILMLVYVGYLFVVAQGNDSKLTEARKALLWTIIGALILLGAQAISLGIQQTVQALSVGG